MFSIETGKFTSNSLLCQSGFAAQKSDTVSQSLLIDSIGILMCWIFFYSCLMSESKSFWMWRNIYFCTGDTKTGKGKCTCSATGQKGYCSITTDKDEWKDYIKIYKEVTSQAFGTSDHIQVLRNSLWGSAKLAQAPVNIYNYARLKDADKCAIRSLSSSTSIKYSFFPIFAIILVFA